MGGRIPPYSAEAEQAILGAILLDNSVLARIATIAEPKHFYVEANKWIYQAMIDVAGTGTVVDHVTLGNYLKEQGYLEKIGGAIALAGLTDNVATSANADHYAEIVRSQYAVRRMIHTASEIFTNGFSHREPSEYLHDSRRAVTRAASELSVGAGPQHLDQDMNEIIRELETGEKPAGIIQTGITEIDKMMDGLWPGLLTVIAGRPAMGKSAVVLNIATNAAMAGKKVLYFTLEDVRRYVVSRMLARFANIDLAALTLRNVPQSAWPRIIEAAKRLGGKKPLWIEDGAGLTSPAIHQIAAAHKIAHGLDLAIIDHLGEIADEGDGDTAIITKGAANFRDMAKELGIPVLLACQLNRGVESRQDKRPQLSDLKQSGKIEEVARFVFMLYRAGYYIGDESRKDLELWVRKANHGKTGLIRLYADLSRMYVRGWDDHRDGLFLDDSNSKNTGKSGRQNNQQNLPMGGRYEY